MSLELVRSNGVKIKTHPSYLAIGAGELCISQPGQDSLYFSLQRGLDEVEYSLHELMMRRHDVVAIRGFKRYLASVSPTTDEDDEYIGREISLYQPAYDFETYQIPELTDKKFIDWCGVLVDPTDLLHASGYVVTNTPIELDDPRTTFIEAIRSGLAQ